MLLLSLFTGLSQLTFAFGQDVLIVTGQSILGGHITNGTVQPNVIIVPYKLIDNPPRIVKREWRFGPDTVRLEGSVPAFQFAVTLRVAG